MTVPQNNLIIDVTQFSAARPELFPYIEAQRLELAARLGGAARVRVYEAHA